MEVEQSYWIGRRERAYTYFSTCRAQIAARAKRMSTTRSSSASPTALLTVPEPCCFQCMPRSSSGSTPIYGQLSPAGIVKRVIGNQPLP